nr:RNA-directed DNA polymerase, eukaryota [Tanacetum cinerariifolium]
MFRKLDPIFFAIKRFANNYLTVEANLNTPEGNLVPEMYETNALVSSWGCPKTKLRREDEQWDISMSLNIVEPNGLIRLKKKLQALKIAIKAWSKEANKRSNDRKINIQQNLSEVDKLIDQGKSNDEILIKRITLLNDLQEHNNRNAVEISQKAKIRWSIENQVQDLERTVTYEEAKRAVWDCGTSKSRCFYLASLLKDNLLKNKLMEIGVSSNVVAAIAAASLIVCAILTAPFNYLDVKVPISVLNHLESIRQNFFYGVDGSDRKLAWIG